MKKIVISVCVATSLFIFAGLTHAQGYTPLVDLPGVTTVGTHANMSAYLSGAIKLLIALGGAFSILMTIIGGTQYVASGIAPDAKNEAKERITNAIIGLILVLTSYLILNSINPNLVAFNLGLPPVGAAPASAPTPDEHIALIPLTPRVNTAIHSPIPATSVASTGSVVTPVVPAPSATGQSIDRSNDYSIISHCSGNTTYDLCSRTDLNSDGRTDSVDLSIFVSRGISFDINRNNTVELADLPPPATCFFKIATVDLRPILPRQRRVERTMTTFCGGSGTTMLPTLTCNNATWIRASLLGSTCAPEATLLNLDVVWASGPYDKFRNLITSSTVGGVVNLSILFQKTFFDRPRNGDSRAQADPYYENTLGKITYATIAKYDLNDDGLADFSASGADMGVFNGCKGGSVSGVCAQADFNGDGAIDDRDVAVSGTREHPVLGSMADLVRNHLGIRGMNVSPSWTLGDFESYFFDPTGYSDKQIISYWMGRKAVYGSRIGDLNGDRIVDSLDLGVFNNIDTGAPPLDFNGDGVVNLQL